MTTDRSPSEVIAALEVALEAGPTAQEWIVSSAMDIFPFNGSYLIASCGGKSGLYRNSAANAPFIAACSPLAIRTLLDAHASALRDAEMLEALLARYIEQDIQTGNVENNLFRSARAAMGANTKGVSHV